MLAVVAMCGIHTKQTKHSLTSATYNYVYDNP